MPPTQAAAEIRRYPASPWSLRGRLELFAWLVPADELDVPLPQGWRPVSLFGRRLVGGVWARYGPEGDLSYRELAVGVLVRRGLRLGVTLPWIWVDNDRSLAGGRSLWAIPKRRARFRQTGGQIEATEANGRLIAASASAAAPALPGRWPAWLQVAQPSADGAVVTPGRVRGRPFPARRIAWRAAGPLSFLDDRTPLVALRLEDVSLRFGRPEGFD